MIIFINAARRTREPASGDASRNRSWWKFMGWYGKFCIRITKFCSCGRYDRLFCKKLLFYQITKAGSMEHLMAETPSIPRFRIRSTWVKRKNALDKFTSGLSRDRLAGNCQMRTQQSSADYLCSVGWQGLKSRHLDADMLLIQFMFITTKFINLA